jgi:sulfatase maturation enzyme AslB (radical SAM superfamily)
MKLKYYNKIVKITAKNLASYIDDEIFKEYKMRHSLYWDNFEQRAKETIDCIKNNKQVPIRRVAIFITNRCNFRCKYCNHLITPKEMTEETFDNIIQQYGKSVIYHITGGEPTLVPWLYPYIEKHAHKYNFHLNTNAYIKPHEGIKRIKVSLDSWNNHYWNELVGKNAFEIVVNNIKEISKNAITSITYTITHQNIDHILEFIKWQKFELPNIYAIFFSIYKGIDSRFVLDKYDCKYFFEYLKPRMLQLLDPESSALLNETITEKFRLMENKRFPENSCNKCYISLSERVYSPEGQMYGCSHLYRDNVYITPGTKHKKCLYGCNRRLVEFNNVVQKGLEK